MRRILVALCVALGLAACSGKAANTSPTAAPTAQFCTDLRGFGTRLAADIKAGGGGLAIITKVQQDSQSAAQILTRDSASFSGFSQYADAQNVIRSLNTVATTPPLALGSAVKDL